jgi:Transmembrane amino acid transporter protein
MGYLGYRDETQGNILENLGRNNLPANVARAMLGTTMLFVYPVESFVARHVCVELLFSGRSAHEGNDAHILSRRDRRIGLTMVLYLLAVIPAILTNDVGPVLALTGAVGGSCLSYLGPGVIYLGVHGERFLALARQAFGAVRKFDHVAESNMGNDLILSAEDGSRPTTGITITTSIDKNRLRALETTPLVARGEMNRNVNDEYVEVVGVWNHLVWYLTGMPIWCWIARLGNTQLQEHITEMAMKSPHPIRIGDVEYKRMVIPIDDDYNENNTNDILTANPLFGTDRNKMVRDQSLPQLSNLVSPTGGSTTMTTPFSMSISTALVVAVLAMTEPSIQLYQIFWWVMKSATVLIKSSVQMVVLMRSIAFFST